MNINAEDVNGVLIISVPRMDLDASKSDDFKKSVAPLVQGQSKVIMDMSGIGFMDSAGLGAILSVFKKVRADGGQFKICSLSDEVKALFDLVRMQRLLEVYPDRDSALQSFKTT